MIKRFIKTASRLTDRVMEGFAWLAGALMMFSLITVCIDVVMRYFFNRPIGWVLQFSEYILLYIPFLAAAYVFREESHIRIDILICRLSDKARNVMNMITSIMGCLVLLILSYYGSYVTFDFYQRKVPTLKYIKIPEFLVIMVIPVGCLLFSIQFMRSAINTFRALQKKEKEAE